SFPTRRSSDLHWLVRMQSKTRCGAEQMCYSALEMPPFEQAQAVRSNYSTAQKGEIAMLRVLQRSAERGWLASRPTRDCRYDLVLDDGARLYRVQVKYAGRRATHCEGAVSLDFTKGGTRNGIYLDREIDAVLAYVAP